eukprot:323977_1
MRNRKKESIVISPTQYGECSDKKTQDTGFNYYYCIFGCCFLFLLPFITHPSYQIDIQDRLSRMHQTVTSIYDPSFNKSEIYSFNNHSVITQICDPAYIIFQRTFAPSPLFIDQLATKYGFDLRCTIFERQKLGLESVVRKKQYRYNYKQTAVCLKYNDKYNKSINNNPFCGQTLISLNTYKMETGKHNFIIKHKTGMNLVLTTYCNTLNSKDNNCNFHLLSYDVSVEEERIEFLSKHINCNNNNAQFNKTWVFKEALHGGKGIHIINNHHLIYQLITANISEHIENCTFNPITNESYFIEEGFKYYKTDYGFAVNRNGLLIQEFIANPLLIKLKEPNSDVYKEHNFNMRSYLLIASYSNPFIVFNYNKPFFLLNPNYYNNKQEKINKKAIITNRDMVDEEMHPYWVWGHTEMQNYLDKMYGEELFGGNYTLFKLNSDVNNMLMHVFSANSYYHNNVINSSKDYSNFQFDIVCVDIIINDKFELKLLEMNNRCGMKQCYPKWVKNKAIKGGYDWECDKYFSEITSITMEIFEKKHINKQTIDKIDSAHNFEIVYWEK